MDCIYTVYSYILYSIYVVNMKQIANKINNNIKSIQTFRSFEPL